MMEDPKQRIHGRMATIQKEPQTLTLPQPRKQNYDDKFDYILLEKLDECFFPNRLEPRTLCWVLKSKGLQSKRNDNRSAYSQRSELFLRARVVKDDEFDNNHNEYTSNGRRVLVRYPKGSTYRVKRSNLIPVLEPRILNVVTDDRPGSNDYHRTKRRPVVLITAETPEYRRAAVVHTCLGDSFLEIGCAFGACVDRVQRALQSVSCVTTDPTNEPICLLPTDQGRVWCLGIDKSTDAIDIASKKFPHCRFSVEDALTHDGREKLEDLCIAVLQNRYPSVVGIDINGNREIPAVLQCLDHIMNPQSDGWILPRLILVKSRLLHKSLEAKP